MKLQRQASSFFVFTIISFFFIVFSYSPAKAWKVRNYYADAIGLKCADCNPLTPWDDFKQDIVGAAEELSCPGAESKCGGGKGARLTIFWKGFNCADVPLGVPVPADGLMEIHPTEYWICKGETVCNQSTTIQRVYLQKASILCPRTN